MGTQMDATGLTDEEFHAAQDLAFASWRHERAMWRVRQAQGVREKAEEAAQRALADEERLRTEALSAFDELCEVETRVADEYPGGFRAVTYRVPA